MESNVKFIPDIEISLYKTNEDGKHGNDLLNTLPYVDALEQCVKKIPEDKSVTIGLYGEWGSGKSSILRTLKEKLEVDTANGYKFVTYDAWKYSQDSFRRMFLFELQNQLGVERSDKMDRFYDNINDDIKISHKINIIPWLIGIIILVIFSIVCVYTTNVKAVFTFSAMAAILTAIFNLTKSNTDNLKLTVQKTRLFAPEQFEECYGEIINSALNPSLKKRIWTKLTGGKEYKKIIIIVDNVDRCSTQHAQELLTTIKAFMGKENVIYIIPIAVNALINHLVKSSNGEIDNKEANEYLRKFFNVSLWIKPFQNDEMYDFTNHLNDKYKIGLSSTSISIISREFATNPRRIIQLLNNIIEEFSLYDEKFIKENESLICILLIIREEFQNYYQRIVYNPCLLFDEPSDKDYSPELVLFWKRTRVTILSYRYKTEILDHTLSNSKVFVDIPQNIINALGMDEIDVVTEFVNNHPVSGRKVISCLKNKVYKAFTRKLDNDILNLTQTICSMYATNLLIEADEIMFANLFEPKYDWKRIIPFFSDKDYHALIDFSLEIHRLNYSKLLQDFITCSRKLLDIETEEDKMPHKIIDGIYYLCSVIPKTLINDELVALFQNAYNRNYYVDCFKYTYPESMNFFNNKLINGLLSVDKPEKIFGLNGIHWQFIQISKQIKLNETTFNQYIDVLTSSIPNYDNGTNNIKVITLAIDDFSEFIETNKDIKITNDSHLKAFTDKIFLSTNIAVSYNRSVRKDIIINNADNEEVLGKLVKLFEITSQCAHKIIIRSDIIKELIDNKIASKRLIDSLVKILQNRIDISDLSDLILGYNDFNDNNYLEILRNFLSKKDNGELRLSESKVQTEIEQILDLLGKAGNKQLTDFIISVSRDPTVMSILVSSISKYKIESLLKLPLDIQRIAVSQFESKLDSFKNNIQVLSIVASQGSNEVMSKLADIITVKLVEKESISDAIALIKEMRWCNEKSYDALIAVINKKDDKELNKENKEECLKHLKEILAESPDNV